MRYFLATLLSTTLLLILITPSHAATCDITVKPGPNNPIQTGIIKAKSGDTVCVAKGTYHELVSINQPNISLIGEGVGNTIIDGKKTIPSSGDGYTPLIYVEADGVTIDGIEVRNSNGEGFRVESSENVNIKNCKSSWSIRSGMNTRNSQNVTIDSCLFEYGTMNNKGNGGSVAFRNTDHSTMKNSIVRYGQGEGVNYFIGTNGSYFNNTIYDNNKVNIYYENASGMVIDSNLIYYTKSSQAKGQNEGIHQAQEVSGQYGGKSTVTKDNTITNNAVIGAYYNLKLTGGCNLGETIPGYGFKNLKIANNTFINGTYTNVRIAKSGCSDHNPSDDTPSWFENNIVIQDNDDIFEYDTRDITKFTFRNNLYTKYPGKEASGSKDIITNKPGLKNYSITLNDSSDFDPQNYTLISSSPAIDAGYVVPYLKWDFQGSIRPTGKAYDIGFHEFGGTPTTPKPPKWDLNRDNNVDILDFSYLLIGFASNYSFPDLSQFSSAL